ncbi:MAG: AbgT family transporter [Gemmatimonadetes bacterium]|nr:AbgT family transporter [Gemmatimonadota bacterium]NNM03884.1 AbgT family transporter [Gemmatimonadota bacterium]
MAKGQPRSQRFLDWVERTGNRLPDPAVHFLIALALTWALSLFLSGVDFGEIDPRTGASLQIVNQLTPQAMAGFLSTMVTSFVGFPPLGVVLVMVLGVGVAEHSGLVGAGLKRLLDLTPPRYLTPMLATVSIASHTIADAAFVAVVPLGGALFYAAGRHPLAGLVVAFCGIGGAFAANFVPSGLDPLLQGFTEQAAQILDPDIRVNPLCNWGFMSFSAVFLVLATWWVTDRIVEPRLKTVAIDGDPDDLPEVHPLSKKESRALLLALAVFVVMVVGLWLAILPVDSPLRGSDGGVTAHDAPLMQAIIPIMFLFTVLPGMAYGYAAGTFKSHKDVIKGMSEAMSSMGYYMVLVFFAAMFTKAFADSNLGALLALKGAAVLQALGLPAFVTILGIILLTGALNLLVGSASAKWAMLAPVLVPMLMAVGISPELTQMAYRIGDSPTNVITPLLPYFPLLVAFSIRYVKNTGIGTLISLTLPYSISYLIVLVACLAVYWGLDLPLGIQAGYVYP